MANPNTVAKRDKPMLDTLSIRLKIILLSGLCLLGVIGLIVSLNLYQSIQNNQLISMSSSKMLTQSGENLLQATAAEQASQLQRAFGDSLLIINVLSDQAANLRNMAAQRGLTAATLREELNRSLKPPLIKIRSYWDCGWFTSPVRWMVKTVSSPTTPIARLMKTADLPAPGIGDPVSR